MLTAIAALLLSPPLLVGTVGPAFTITLDVNGRHVQRLAPGTYTLLVHDRSPGHNFHIFGPGLDDVVTTPEFVGDETVTVDLVAGTYAYQCDPHVGEMSGGFTVGVLKPKAPTVKPRKRERPPQVH